LVARRKLGCPHRCHHAIALRVCTGAKAAVGRTLDDPIVSLYDGTLIALTRRNVVEVPDDLLAEIEAFASDLERRDHAFAVVVQPAGYDPPVRQGPVIALPGGGNDPDRWTPN
jgi:hypothetical protein